MKKRKSILTFLLLTMVLFLIWFQKKPTSTPLLQEPQMAIKTNASIESETHNVSAHDSVGPKPTNEFQQIQAHLEQVKQRQEQEISLWQSPLLYYGKVVDESNQPISGVQVSYNASAMNESREEIQNTGIVVSDERGIFKIDGVKGVGLMLQLSHPNYYPYPDNSTGFDKRSLPRKGYFSDSEERAELFHMHSKGHPVHLIYYEGGFHAPNDGSIANFPLRGNTRAEILGQLQVQGWNGLRSETNAYDWEIQLTLPNGGIIESTNYFDFIAPKSDYSESVTFEVAGSEVARKQYFLKLPAGYIRFKLEVIMGKDMFVVGEYYFNPDGSTNLEPGP